jgi:hypothetical protein
MNADRAIGVAAAIDRAAKAEGVAVAVRHVCLACAAVLGATGAALSAVSDLGSVEPLYATGPGSEQVMDAQVMLGEGPSVAAQADGRPMLVPDLAYHASQRRWPAFAPAAIDIGIRAVFAFPLALGAISVGVLEIHRESAGSLSANALADALLFGDMATMRVLDHLSGQPADGTAPVDGGLEYRWAEVHQATGVVSVQLNTTLAAALLRLRAHAYSTGRRLSEVAHDVLAGRLRLESGNDDQNQG